MMTTRSEEAARWFAALRRGVMTLEERAAYGEWSSDGANEAAMREIEALWSGLDAARPALWGAAAPRTRRAQPARAMMLALACVASLGIGIASFGESTFGGDEQFWTALDWSSR